jgi:hypothetical protein
MRDIVRTDHQSSNGATRRSETVREGRRLCPVRYCEDGSKEAESDVEEAVIRTTIVLPKLLIL